MSQQKPSFDFWDRSAANAPARLEFIVESMREMSRLTDPQTVVQTYGRRMRQILPTDMTLSLSRRDLEFPKFRITRSPRLGPNMNPWTMKDRLQVYEGGLLAQLIYSDTPQILNDPAIDPSDPAREFLEGHRSICAVPLFDQGVALNMVVLMRKDLGAFLPERLPEQVWMSNLFGRSTQNLVLSTQLKQAYDNIEAELRVVADIQRSLLPSELPEIPTLDLAAYYQTSRLAGGDYYDFFPLPDGQWGILIADVSGHGTPAAVMMAITHSIAHNHDGPPTPPSAMLGFLNRQLSARYAGNGNFVTAFYGIYDPRTRAMTYSCAGHNPPRVKRCSTGELLCLDGSQSLPLGIMEDEDYCNASVDLVSGDFVVFYTDGITEARAPVTHELFGTDRLDHVVATCPSAASALIQSVLEEVDQFTRHAPPTDDRTILIARVT